MKLIKSGSYKDERDNVVSVEIYDDTSGETGGYYLLFIEQNKSSSDLWFEKKSYLDCQLEDYDINWN